MKTQSWSLEELDIQYNARAAVPQVDDILAQYTLLTTSAKASVRHEESVQYSSNPDETIDFYYTSERGAPVFVFIHGGYWRALSKDDSGFMAPALTEAGANVAVLNYSLAPAVTLDHIVDQVRRALVWLFGNVRLFGGDPQRIHICGSSAGGHLVGMLLEEGWTQRYGVPEDAVKSATPISGLFDLEPLLKTHVNAWLNHDLSGAQRNSPILRSKELACPLVVAYADGETEAFKMQSIEFANRWASKGGAVELIAVSNTNHFDIVFSLMDKKSVLFRAVAKLMGLSI